MRVGLVLSLVALALITIIIFFKYQQATKENVSLSQYAKQLGTLTGIGELGSTHEHVAFLYVVNGEPFDLSASQYQLRSRFVHFEDGVGDVIHKHATGVTLNQFLVTLGIDMRSHCIILEAGKSYCKSTSKTLQFFVNGKPVFDIGMYELADGDQVLLAHGTKDEALKKYFDQLHEIQEKRQEYFEKKLRQVPPQSLP